MNDNPKSLKSIDSVSLVAKGFAVVEMTANNKRLKIIVSSAIENSVRVIYIDSFFVLCNYSSHSLNFWSFCLPNNEKFEFRSIRSACYEQQTYKTIPSNTKDASNP